MDSPDAPALYTERLAPPASVHLVSLVLGGIVLLGVTPFTSPVLAALIGLLVAAASSAALVLSSPVVAVIRGGDPADGGAPDEPRLRAGGAVIPVGALGAAEVVDADGLQRLMRTDADARAHVCHRGWMSGAVRVPVTDPRDATPYWLVCTRRPAQLVAALGRRESQLESRRESWTLRRRTRSTRADRCPRRPAGCGGAPGSTWRT
ncbi:DUF3093 domain-containing protein [Georgenia yuyongxinii]